MNKQLFNIFSDWSVIFSNNNIDDIEFDDYDDDEDLEMTINEDIEFISECS